jgi:hypothetical protein
MKRLAIIGGGVSGLVAAETFNMHGWHTTLIEGGRLGGEFLAGGLKYIHKTDEMTALLKRLEVQYSAYNVRGGIHLRGEVLPYPQCFDDMEARDIARIQADHYRKTRRTGVGEDAERAMNDPAALGPRRALRCDFQDLIDTLSDVPDVIVESFAKRIDPERNVVHVADGTAVVYDALIITVPLWVIQKLVPFYIPEGMAMSLNVVQVTPRRDDYAGFDYVYTPYTPHDCVHRLSPARDGYSVEANGVLNHIDLHADLSFLFPDGFNVESIKEGLKGHLLPLDVEPDWPANIRPLGRFATWNPRATTDVTLSEVMAMAEEWT